jgi:anti-sigma B factor antagonist
MGIELRREARGSGVVVVSVAGELDLAATDGLVLVVRGALRDAKAREVLIDLSGAEFLDAAGVGGLMRAGAETAAARVPFRVRGARDLVASVLRVSGAAEVLGMVDPPDSAGTRAGV